MRSLLKSVQELNLKMDQASGGEDPNKPNKKKEKEDESKNKKLVGIFRVFLSQLPLKS